jgi:histone-lysine N-methyltransferase SETD1
MSRASGASFAQFFPSAPRAAKDKAKEREKVKTQIPESTSSFVPVADSQVTPAVSRVEDVASHQTPSQSNIPITDFAPLPAEDNESILGDLLNGVGSASSHTSSSVSSVFSASAQQPTMSTFGVSQNVSNLTPLTNIDSSPNRITSPNQYKSDTQATVLSGFTTDGAVAQNDIGHTHNSIADPSPTTPHIYTRDPNKGVKGEKCTYDPLLDHKLSDREKKKAKPIYKEFGLVRTHNLLRERHLLFVRMSG